MLSRDASTKNQRRQAMGNYTMFVGLDVHKDSIEILRCLALAIDNSLAEARHRIVQAPYGSCCISKMKNVREWAGTVNTLSRNKPAGTV